MDPALYTAEPAHGLADDPCHHFSAIPMYEQFQILRKTFPPLCGRGRRDVTCIAFLLACGLLLRLEPTILVSLLPKSVTTAIGVPLSELYGGMGALTTAAIIVTGILGNMLGTTLCRLFRITDPIAQGVAFGTSAHVIGTSKAGELSLSPVRPAVFPGGCGSGSTAVLFPARRRAVGSYGLFM